MKKIITNRINISSVKENNTIIPNQYEEFNVIFNELKNDNTKLIKFINLIIDEGKLLFENEMFKTNHIFINEKLRNLILKVKNNILEDDIVFEYINTVNKNVIIETDIRLDNLIATCIIFNIRIENINLVDKEFDFYIKEIIKNINVVNTKNIIDKWKDISSKSEDYKKNKFIKKNIMWYNKFHGIHNIN